ncbi:MAG: hypothetical protein JST68_27320 [Bacteroidetes bacterium]|nr:hypothetical protein [Bacteroidota bacterium]
MGDILFQSDRYFNLQDAVCSHGQLLLRSQMGAAHSTTIDIIFQGTYFIQLCTMLWGVTIRWADEGDFKGYESIRNRFAPDGNRLFEVVSGGEKYYVGAGSFGVYENALPFGTSSLGFEISQEEKGKLIAASFEF